MAVRKNFIRLLIMAATSLLLTGNRANAAEQEQIPRFSFELHCKEPLLGSRWEQPQHEVYRMLDSLEEFKAEHPHEGILDAKLWRISRDGDFQNNNLYHRAFCAVVVQDPALHDAVLEWLAGLEGIQPDTIQPETCDPAVPFAQHPPVDIIINGATYHYPADFSPLERDWAGMFARTNYPNQSMFIIHPDARVTGRFGLGELAVAYTHGDGKAIEISTLEEEFPLGGLEIPAGMDLYPEFLPTHLVPEDEAELYSFLLGRVEKSITNYSREPGYGNVSWQQLDFPLSGNANEQAAMAGTVFSGWLAGYPEFESGAHFGECSMRVVRDTAAQPVQITLRLDRIGIADRHLLVESFSGIGLEPAMEFHNNPPASLWFGERQLIAEHGFLLRNLENKEIDREAVQSAVDSYMDWRADILPPLAGSSVEVDTKEIGQSDVVRMKASMPSTFELGQMKDWVAREVPLVENWQIDHDVWQQEEPAGSVVINGRTYSYPEDFAGLETRQLANVMNYGVGQLVVGVFAGLDYSRQDDSQVPEEFQWGDLCLIERTEDGVVIETLEQDWDHGVDIEALDIPNGMTPNILANYPRWFGMDEDDIRQFAREELAGYSVLRLDEERAKPTLSYRTIIANPIASTKLQGKFPGELTEILSAEEKQATLSVTRQAYDALLGWIADTDGYTEEDLTLGMAGLSKNHTVTFNANDQPDFVFQIQIGVAGASDEELVDLMDRIYLATGMHDIWAMGNLFPSLLLDDPETVNSAATDIRSGLVSSEN